MVTGKTKSNRTVTTSKNRSRFIGVSKNGPNWQALISVNKKKMYVGTYDTEVGAAKAFDMFSLILNKLSAVTNFSYTRPEILNLAEEYRAIKSNNLMASGACTSNTFISSL